MISEFKPDGIWGNFCLDTWDFINDSYDYSADNKQEPTASYLAMLRDNEIDPEYSGFCMCLDWDKFLYVTLQCVMQHIAPYSVMFYIPDKEIVFYFHHTASFGVYYKELNEEVIDILKKVQDENMEIKNFNDPRLSNLLGTSK